MLLFTGNPGSFLLLLFGLFLLLWAGFSAVSFWSFKQTEYYKTQWPTESEPAKALIKLLVGTIAFAVSWLMFF